ncbi:MAG TPA: ABC transporter permease [Acidobacteriaceae bacterium]|jgi:predicted permease
MSAFNRLFGKLQLLVRREGFRRDLEEELAFHREQKQEELRGRGVPPEAVRSAAAREVGNPTLQVERSHEVVAFRWETFLRDVRFAFRQLRRAPGFAVAAILMLALGMAASLAFFSFVDAALVRPLPYTQPNQLMDVSESGTLFRRSNISYFDFVDWRRMNHVFSSLEAYAGTGFLLKTPHGSEPVAAAKVSAGFFRVLGIKPYLGRDFSANEDQPNAAKTVMLTYGAWQQRFGGRTNMVGEQVALDGELYTVIGVLPATFEFAPRSSAELWVPLTGTSGCEKRRSCHNLYAVGRLKDGVTVPTALAEMKSIAADLERQYPASNRGQGALVRPLAELIVGDIRPILLMLLAGAGLLLLIACVNVASLLLVRCESRRREIAVRGALGASSARLARQFITEGAVLVLASTVIGVFVAGFAIRLVLKLVPKAILTGMPFLHNVGIHGHTFWFAIAIAVFAGTLFSITPILRLPLKHLRDGLIEGSQGAGSTLWRRLGSNLVVLELAIAVVLLSGAGLLGRSLYRLLHVDLAFQPDHLALMYMALPPVSYAKSEQQVAALRNVMAQLATVPGVQSVSAADLPAMNGNGNTTWMRFVGKPYDGKHQEANQRSISVDYFRTLQTRLLKGRLFTEDDDASKPQVAIINSALARKYFPNEDPIGKQVGDTNLTPSSLKQIVGVVDDIHEAALGDETWPAIYYPFKQSPGTFTGLVIRTSQDEDSVLPALAAAIRKVDPDIGVTGETTMTRVINDSQSAYIHRASAWLVGSFAALALVLGVFGLYGVIAYSVSRRTREIGVRMALGAQRGAVYGLILREAGRLAVFGIVVGLVGSVAAAALIRSLLFNTTAWDPATLLSVALVLGIFSMLAAYLPARRAATIEPARALHAD